MSGYHHDRGVDLGQAYGSLGVEGVFEYGVLGGDALPEDMAEELGGGLEVLDESQLVPQDGHHDIVVY